MTQDQPVRFASLVLVGPGGEPRGALPPMQVSTPWWPDAAPVVAAARELHGLDVVVLRLLSADRPTQPGGWVVYLAETASPAIPGAVPETATADHPLRQSWARPGGPARDLAWARGALARQDRTITAPPVQVRTWNLSSLWRLPTAEGDVWLKAVPPFFAHEGAVIDLLAPGPVPALLAHERGRILIGAIPGEDLYGAPLALRLEMITRLVALQVRFVGRLGQLEALGLPDWRLAPLATGLANLLAQHCAELAPEDAALLADFIAALPARFAALAGCGIPDTLVHGDFHEGNVRGGDGTMTLLDWADSGIGHPLLDQAAFFAKVPADQRADVRDHWHAAWQHAVPGCDPAGAAALLAPVAAARQALIYRKFLDNIEPSEHVYHHTEPLDWLRQAASLLRQG